MRSGMRVAFFILLSSVLLAEESGDTTHIQYYFNPIVKTGTRTAGAQRDIAASLTVIGPDRLATAFQGSVFEVVKAFVPSLYLTEWNVMGYGVAGAAAGKVSVRGIGGTADTHVMILRNGRPDFMGLMGCTIADEFATDGVERIEILRGPASFLYGTNATAGVINVIPAKRDREGFETRLRMGYGGFGTQKYGISHLGKKGRLDYAVTASRKSTEGYRSDAKDTYKGQFVTGHVGITVGPGTYLEANANVADLFLYDPGLVNSPKNEDWYDILRWGGDVALQHQGRLGETTVQWHGNFGKHRFADGWRSWDQMFGVVAYHHVHFVCGNTTTMGIDLKQYGGRAEGSVPPLEKKVMEYGPYLHLQQLLTRWLILSGGIRFEHHSVFGSVWVPKAGAVIHFSDAQALRMSVSKGFRSPSLRELYFFASHNEALKPDEIWNGEVGLTQKIGRRCQIDVTVYHNEGKNLIALAKRVSGPGYQLTNIGKVENNGLELEAFWFPFERFQIGVSGSLLDMKYEIPNTPRRKASFYANWAISGIDLSCQILRVEDWKGRDASVPLPKIYPMADYTVVDLSATMRWRGIETRLALKNAFDQKYEAMYGYPMPGRLLLAEVGYTF